MASAHAQTILQVLGTGKHIDGQPTWPISNIINYIHEVKFYFVFIFESFVGLGGGVGESRGLAPDIRNVTRITSRAYVKFCSFQVNFRVLALLHQLGW